MRRATTLKIGSREIALTNPDKVLYPAGKVTKARVIEYYAKVGPILLPHLKNRPVTLKRHPDGIFGEAFYEKNAPAFTPSWVTALLDGEIVAVNAQGKPSFQMLQNRASLGREWHIVYYAFDLLELNGADLKNRPLCDRKELLEAIIRGSDVRYSAELAGDASAVSEAVEAAGLEGIVAKQRTSAYRPATRSKSWLKLKLAPAQEFVIGGYNPASGGFQSILVGFYEGTKLIFAGKVRQGFNPASRRALFEAMQPLLSAKCPFANLPSSKKSHFGEGVTAEEMTKLRWLKPRLVAQVSFTEWTSYGVLRHATFEGLRDDKKSREGTRETAR